MYLQVAVTLRELHYVRHPEVYRRSERGRVDDFFLVESLFGQYLYVYVQNLLDHPRGRAEHRFDPLSDGDLLRFDPADLLNFGEKTS